MRVFVNALSKGVMIAWWIAPQGISHAISRVVCVLLAVIWGQKFPENILLCFCCCCITNEIGWFGSTLNNRAEKICFNFVIHSIIYMFLLTTKRVLNPNLKLGDSDEIENWMVGYPVTDNGTIFVWKEITTHHHHHRVITETINHCHNFSFDYFLLRLLFKHRHERMRNKFLKPFKKQQ